MTDEVTITLQEGNSAGRYVANVDGFDVKAQLTFRRTNERQITVDHTRVPDAIAGRGIATALVRHAVADARKKEITIIPNCSFVRAQAEKHPEWSDVIKI